ncbi:MAG: dihydrolipoamide acetyltransferase family protein [Actinomycetota bacterium]
MGIEIKMPQLSQATDSVKLVKWLASEGDEVKKGDPICEVETDKTNMELESYAGGYIIKKFFSPGDQIYTGNVVAVIGEKGEKYEVTKGKKKPKKEVKKTGHKKKAHKESRIKATKIVKNLAKLKKIDIGKVKGTGPGGLVTRKDLEDYQNQKKEVKQKEYKLSSNQMVVSKMLSMSKKEIPHFYLKTEICADALFTARDKLGGKSNKVSFYSFFIYAAAKALEKYPRINSIIKDDTIKFREKINIGFALSNKEELYVPVIEKTNGKNIKEIDAEVTNLKVKASNNNLEKKDIMNGTFTITNLGAKDIDEFYAIINPPQLGIISIGKIKKTLDILDGPTFRVKDSFVVTGSFDHRAVNGSLAAEFLGYFKKVIEEDIKNYEI